MMKYILVILSIFYYSTLLCQQEGLYTQFAFNKIIFNPASAGENNYTTLSGLTRNQWSGIPKAPKSQFVSANFKPIAQKIGLGFSFSKSNIGIQEKLDFSSMFSFKQKLNRGILSYGFQFSGRRYTTDFTDPDLLALDGFEFDPSIVREIFTTNVFNAGLGILYEGPNLYLGVSVPRLLEGSLTSINLDGVSSEERHSYIMFGSKFKLNAEWNYEPQLLLKLADNSPFNLDFVSLFSYQEKIYLGANIRTGGAQSAMFESFDMILGFQFSSNLFAGMSYDFSLSELRKYENGSFELMLSYRFDENKMPRIISNPRYF